MEKNGSHTNVSSITRQIQAIFAASILILLVSSYASYFSMQKLIENSKLVNHTNTVLIEAEQIVSLIKDAEAGQRGYLLTDDRNFLQFYTGSYGGVMNSLNTLKAMTTDNPVQQANLGRLKLLVDDKYKQMQRTIDLSENLKVRALETFKQQRYQEMANGRKIMQDLRVVVNEIKNLETELLDKRTTEQERYISYTPILLVIAAIISIIITIISYLRIKSDLDQRAAKQLEEQRVYKETSERISAMEGITRQIAGGNYSVRSTDPGDDELGRVAGALNNMATSLEESFNDLETRSWLQAGSVRISDAMRGQRQVRVLSENLLAAIALYIDARLATLYVTNEDGSLRLSANYGSADVPAYLNANEGMIAQALKLKTIVTIDDVPANYLKVTSSLGEAIPASLVLCPLLYNDEVLAVLELGFFGRPDENDMNLLELNREAMAIGINAALSYELTQNLLEETQAQAEELQTQHNELESLNVELEAQAQNLQASEEELKVQQEELQQTNQELEERTRLLEERNIEIFEKNKEVQRKAEELALSTKYKSEFLANMSHELRTPLNSILLLSRLMAENTEDNLTSDQIEYAKVIQSSGNGLLSLIDEILDLSKIEAGKMKLEYEETLMKDVATDIRMLFEPVAREKGVEFEVTVTDDVPVSMETDKQRLEQILKNLLSNALKFTSVGSVRMDIKPCDSDYRYVCFVVTDTGIGIPLDKQRHIFEAFQQADGSTRRKFGGTGLGLSISRELVKLLGGTIDLQSEPGKGSTFTVRVPVSKEYKIEEEEIDVTPPEDVENKAAVQPETPVQSQYISPEIPESIPDDRAMTVKGDKSILIVEDDVNFAKSLLDYTRKQGYRGIVTVRGDEAIDLARTYSPTGILLDLQLPVMSGWEVMEALKKDPITRHIPVHMMSSYEVKKESISKGAIDFINKPVAFEQMQEIFKKLEYVLNREGKKVLIVEENSKHAKALAYFLGTFEINSEIKNNIDDSVDALQSQVDCVILDMGIPDQKAYDMLEEVKKRPGLESLPIIIFTGKSLSMAEETRIKKYADSIIVKTAHSYQRMLDEISLFLHLVEDKKANAKKESYRKLGAMNEVLKDKTVLIVDDDVRNIFSLTKALEKMNMHVITAIDGKEALQKLNDNKQINVVLLDMMMPEMDGYETATRIRQHSKWRDLPVIAVTAKAMTGDRDKCIKAGASDYITKPVDVDQLLSLLRVWLYDKV